MLFETCFHEFQHFLRIFENFGFWRQIDNAGNFGKFPDFRFPGKTVNPTTKAPKRTKITKAKIFAPPAYKQPKLYIPVDFHLQYSAVNENDNKI